MLTWNRRDSTPLTAAPQAPKDSQKRQLKDTNRQECVAIQHKIIHREMNNFRERFPQCVDNNSKHLIDVIFKTK